MDNNALDFELAKSVGEYFRLDKPQMDKIFDDVHNSVMNWELIPKGIGISKSEQELMKGSFKCMKIK